MFREENCEITYVLMFRGTNLEYISKNKLCFHIYIIRQRREACPSELFKKFYIFWLLMWKIGLDPLFLSVSPSQSVSTCSVWSHLLHLISPLQSSFSHISLFVTSTHPLIVTCHGHVDISRAPHMCAISEPQAVIYWLMSNFIWLLWCNSFHVFLKVIWLVHI
jgi:hypothetical protein